MSFVDRKETPVSDDTNESDGQDRTRSSRSQDFEVRDGWKTFCVSEQALTHAVSGVGDDVEEAERALGGQS